MSVSFEFRITVSADDGLAARRVYVIQCSSSAGSSSIEGPIQRAFRTIHALVPQPSRMLASQSAQRDSVQPQGSRPSGSAPATS